MTTDQNKQFVEQLFAEVMNGKDFSAIDKFIGPGYVNHSMPSTKTGAESFKEIFQQWATAFPDMHITVENIMGDSNLVATRGYWTGTHKGSFMGIPATNKQVRVEFIDVWRFENDKLAENWVQMDSVGMMQQLGVMPAPSAG